MKAIVYTQHGLDADHPEALVDTEVPEPSPGPHDLLVEIHAISVNPVDTKVRRYRPTAGPRILGWDAAGIVRAIGTAVTRFRPGDAVYYAGSIDRPGSNAERQCVDERIAGHKPRTLDMAAAAALPLTSITAWELLFDRLRVPEGGGAGQTLLIVGAGGGVGSMLVQLARRLTALTIVGTASRPSTAEWVRTLGAHHVIDHAQPLAAQLRAIGLDGVDHVASLTHTDHYFAQLVDMLHPQGQLALIDDPATLDALPMKRKSLSLHWELMFTRPLFATRDLARQHELLERVAALVDEGTLRTTLAEHFGRIEAAGLRRAHALLESHRSRGKIVLEGFPASPQATGVSA